MTALDVEDLSVRFQANGRPLVAVDRVSLRVPSGSVVGLVGESGSGKSTLARAVVGLVPAAGGRVRIDDADLAAMSASERRRARRQVQLVFQDPSGSLNPRMTVGATLAEAVGAHERLGRGERHDKVSELLDLVSLDRRLAASYPRELSGGQRQRVAIARALAVRPSILICDEITSALDASVAGAILNLLRDLRRTLGLSILFISHNLAVVRYVSDEIGVMYAGRVVEFGSAESLVRSPEHPYTQVLLDAVPRVGRGDHESREIDEQESLDVHSLTGCRFHPRCPVGPFADPSRTRCASEDPQMEAPSHRHLAACHYARPAGSGTDTNSSSPPVDRTPSR
ncbi:MAG TPA: ABC transporter ATP-binding protein [Nocardioidaceae bacterium]|nr:ABC transporter ATP-binding protein [Nocardioidaceae bacterium]